ncbi:type I polyketide synthase, partial [Streptomyces sp. NPDC056500]|uniref:type I polyketide synthase n=1 Tax=Streptomyces sp. NPDC056500 TaxID=3345840 RepID=UPI00369BABA3
AAANAFLDALAHHRHTQGLPATSLAWGLWAERTGLTNGLNEADVERLARRGTAALTTEDGLALFDAALSTDRPTAVPVRLNTTALREQARAGTLPALLRGVVRVPVRRVASAVAARGSAAAGATDLVTRLAGLSMVERQREVLLLVRTQAAAVLGHSSAQAVSADQAFRDIGFDSLTAVELRNRLRKAVGLALSATLVFDYPTPLALAEHLRESLFETDGPLPGATGTSTVAGPSPADDPIAIVSMSCRYPGGADTPEALWELLTGGVDVVSELPTDRGWELDSLYHPDPEHSGTSYVRNGGFIRDVAGFDAGFFGIGPREAAVMDPQQRLLLETSWEAMERAGIDPHSLKGSRTGVFTGISGQDYAGLAAHVPPGDTGYLATGNGASVVSGRVSYTFGLEGPAVTVDTACSSSLVALHLAAQSLRQGECDLALAGGATVMATPSVLVAFSRQRGLAKDGRCKAFGEAADGFGPAEGVGVLLLERLSDAQRNGHTVLAVVSGSAVNQDGASNGLTAPNGPAQQRVIRQALASAGVRADEVDLVEAHGTGTALGDPIEAQALLATYGQERTADRPVWLGSVKSNIGHTLGASGVAGVMKAVLAMRHGVLPKTLHAEVPSQHVDWSAGAVELLTEARPWPDTGDLPRRAGVSSFGISGTNAHVVLEGRALSDEPFLAPGDAKDGGAPPATATAGNESGDTEEGAAGSGSTVPVLWALSGRSAVALRSQAERLLTTLRDRPGLRDTDVALSLARHRSAFDHRAVVYGGGREELVAGVSALAAGGSAAHLVQGEADDGQVAFLFTGQGSQRPGMGRELYRSFPVFAEALDKVGDCLDGYTERPVRDVMFADPGTPEADLLHRTEYTQVALFAFEVALYRLVVSWGVRPDALLGHSVGEIAAAHVAGVLSLPDAARLVAARGRLMGALPADGAMVSVRAGEEEVRSLLPDRSAPAHGSAVENRSAPVDVAAINGATSTVISGDREAVLEVARELEARGRKTRRLKVSHAFHSPHIDPMLEEFERVAGTLSYGRPTVPVVSNVTGRMAGEEMRTPEYWVQHARAAVRFHDGMRALRQWGVTRCLELGPDGALTAMAPDCPGGEPEVPVRAVALGRRGRPEVESVVAGVSQAYAWGVSVSWPSMFGGDGARRVELPTYPFERRRYWLDAPPRDAVAEIAANQAGAGENRFWRAVESGDAGSLADALGTGSDISLRAALPALSALRAGDRVRAAMNDWRYRVVWRPVPADGSLRPEGDWAVLAGPDDGPLRDGVVAALRSHGARAEGLDLPVDGGSGEEIAGLLALAAERLEAPLTGVLLLAPRSAPEEAEVLTPGLSAALGAVRAVADGGADARLWLATRSAVSVGADDAPDDPAQSQLWGLGVVAGLEHPGRWGGLVDLPGGAEESLAGGTLTALCQALAGTAGEDQLAARSSGLVARRLVRAPLGSAPESPWRPEGTVLITGGTGALAGHVARRLAGDGAEHLVLTSRRGPGAPGAGELERELSSLGARVSLVECDVADRAALAGLIADLAASGTPVRAVVHTAGVGDRASLLESGVGEFAEVLRAKVLGARYLDELLPAGSVDAFVLFSSAAAVWGGGGQSAYAAANAYLDGLARRRARQGAAATSVAWGLWDGAGMGEGTDREGLLERGMRPMDAVVASAALSGAVAHGDASLVVADMEWERFAPRFTATRPSPLLSEVPEVRALEQAAGTSVPTDRDREERTVLVARLVALSPADRQSALTEEVRSVAAAVLGHGDSGEISERRSFLDAGFDSLTAVELRNRLNTVTGLVLPATLIFDHPTAVAVARHIASRLPLGEPSSGGSLLEGIGRLEVALEAGSPTLGDEAELIEERLMSLLGQIRDVRGRVPATDSGVDLNTAPVEEVFDFIDELGL